MVISWCRRGISEGVFPVALRATGSLVFLGGWGIVLNGAQMGWNWVQWVAAERPRLSPTWSISRSSRFVWVCARPHTVSQACRANSISPDLAMLITEQLCSHDVQIDIIIVIFLPRHSGAALQRCHPWIGHIKNKTAQTTKPKQHGASLFNLNSSSLGVARSGYRVGDR